MCIRRKNIHWLPWWRRSGVHRYVLRNRHNLVLVLGLAVTIPVNSTSSSVNVFQQVFDLVDRNGQDHLYGSSPTFLTMAYPVCQGASALSGDRRTAFYRWAARSTARGSVRQSSADTHAHNRSASIN